MSLEQAITRNNELLEHLIVVLGSHPLFHEKEPTAGTPEAKTKVKETVKKETVKQEAKPAETEEEPKTAPLTYQETAAMVIRVSNEVSRDRTVAILTGFGLKTLKDAKPEQWAGIVEECQAALKEAA